MKKIILILITILSIIACSSIEIIDKPVIYGNFYSECSIRNVEYYGNYNIGKDSVEMYFIRKEKVFLYTYTYVFDNIEYTFNKDTTYIDKEIYHYNLDQFKDILIKKNDLPRDTTIFKITNNMYCTWECFDEMYKVYVASK